MSSLTFSEPIVIGTSLAAASAATTVPVIPVAPQSYAGASGFQVGNAGSAATDADTAANAPVMGPQLYAGTLTNSWHRQRGTESQTLLPAAARTVTTASADFTNYNARGVQLLWNWSIAGATPSLVIIIEGKDPLSGVYFPLFTAGALTVIGFYTVTMYPGSGNSSPLSRVWRIRITHNNANSNTYSVSGDLIL